MLRRDPPIRISGASKVTEKCEIAGLTLTPDMTFFLAIKETHYDPTQWKEPYEFIPERFYSKSH